MKYTYHINTDNLKKVKIHNGTEPRLIYSNSVFSILQYSTCTTDRYYCIRIANGWGQYYGITPEEADSIIRNCGLFGFEIKQ